MNTSKYSYADMCARIKELRGRESLKYTCTRLEDYGCYILESTLSKYENGQRRMPYDFLVACTRLYGCSMDYLYFGKED